MNQFMLTIIATTILSIVGLAHHHQQQQQPADESKLTSTTPDQQEIKTAEDLLDALDKADANLRDFSARILYSKEQGLLGDIQTRTGNLYFLNESTNITNNNTESKRIRKFRVEFEKLEMGDAVQTESKDYIFDGQWLVERINAEKQFIRREVVQSKDDNYDPLAVDGPFPLPIGQSKAAVLKRFNATLLPPETEEGRLHNFYKLKLTPKEKTRIDDSTNELLDESIENLTLWYDPQTLLPWKILVNEDNGDIKTVMLAKVKLNTNLNQNLFDTTPPDPLETGWRVTIEPFK